jgi:hypothetical protein
MTQQFKMQEQVQEKFLCIQNLFIVQANFPALIVNLKIMNVISVTHLKVIAFFYFFWLSLL